MKEILAFGDSNTWGLIPGTNERYSSDVRWTGILQSRCKDVRILEEGLCGRTTVFEDELRPGRKGVSVLPTILETHFPVDAAIVMLGTNDCKTVYNASPHIIGKGIELCLDELEKHLPAERILLISPILLGKDVWKEEKDPEFSTRSVEVCSNLPELYAQIAEKRCCRFLAASDYAKASSVDDEHLDAGGHGKLADCIYEKLKEFI